jgi:hypothetical protein
MALRTYHLPINKPFSLLESQGLELGTNILDDDPRRCVYLFSQIQEQRIMSDEKYWQHIGSHQPSIV